jgi:hypothetical protein
MNRADRWGRAMVSEDMEGVNERVMTRATA